MAIRVVTAAIRVLSVDGKLLIEAMDSAQLSLSPALMLWASESAKLSTKRVLDCRSRLKPHQNNRRETSCFMNIERHLPM